MKHINEIADSLGLNTEEIIPQGHYKAKIPLNLIEKGKHQGKLILVTAITPTPAGEGKTTTTVGLTQGLGRLGKKVVATLREPSLGPIFGIKGGGTGGGKSRVEPEDEINIHFTGDAHAVGSAHNLLAVLTDNKVQRGQIPGFNPADIIWRRVSDVEDRSLRNIISGIGGTPNAPMRETSFDIVTASEIMAILALSSNLEDLRQRLSKIVVGFTKDKKPITSSDIQAVGSMMALLRHAINPNLVQTSEGQPVLVHTGPFGNIAHGCNSVIADRLGMKYADFVVTEAGFGADLGFEKFMHIKARFNNLEPTAVVLVATIRALKSHGNVQTSKLDTPNKEAVINGMANLKHLIGVVRSFNLPVVVAINKFPSDTQSEVSIVKELCETAGAYATVESNVFTEGGEGGVELAEAVIAATNEPKREISYLYPTNASIEDKVSTLANKVYGAEHVKWSVTAKKKLETYYELGWGQLPVCMAKTHLSISHNRTMKGHPTNYTFHVSDVRASVGAGFIYPVAGNIVTMPGLPSSPRSLEVDADGNIIGL